MPGTGTHSPMHASYSQKAKTSRIAQLLLTGLAFLGLLVFASLCLGFTYLTIAGALDLFGWDLLPFDIKPGALVGSGIIAAGTWLATWHVLTEKQEVPEGLEVTRDNGASLWRSVETVCNAAGAAAPDRIILVPDTNAFAASVAERGPFARKTRVLGLGFPLLNLLTLEQAASVIAHEISHFAAKDSDTVNLQHVAAHAMSSILPEAPFFSLQGFFEHIIGLPAILYLFVASRLGASTSRAAEYRSDALAAELFGEQNTADALITLYVLGETFEAKLMEPLRQAWQEGSPMPQSILGAIDDSVRTSACREQMQAALEHTLEAKSHRFDSHPSLADRLSALGVAPRLPDFAETVTGAKGFFWNEYERIHQAMEDFLRETLFADFARREADVSKTNALLDEIYEGIDNARDPLLAAEIVSLLLERSIHISQSRGKHAELLRRYGDIPSSVCELAQEKLEAEDVAGAEEMLAIFEKHPVTSGEAMKFLGYVIGNRERLPSSMLWLKDWANAPATVERMDAATEAFEKTQDAYHEKAYVKGPLQDHRLEAWHCRLIAEEVCEAFSAVEHIWLTSKAPPRPGLPPSFQMVIEVSDADDIGPVALAGRCCIPGYFHWHLGHALETAGDPLRRAMRDFPGSLIYARRNTRIRRVA